VSDGTVKCYGSFAGTESRYRVLARFPDWIMISLIDRNLGMTGASIWQLTLLPDGRHLVAARILGVGFRIAHADRAGGRHLV
jgi:hypothetical protein